jgi:hypothetical protein
LKNIKASFVMYDTHASSLPIGTHPSTLQINLLHSFDGVLIDDSFVSLYLTDTMAEGKWARRAKKRGPFMGGGGTKSHELTLLNERL